MRRIVPASAGVVTAAAMIAFPLARRGSAARRVVSDVVVAGLAAVTTSAAAARWGPARSTIAGVVTTAGTGLVERVGTSTGVPFGRYQYTGRLRPVVAGVPLAVPVAWWAMAVPARESAHAALGRRSTVAARIVVGAAALTAWDLFLDPQMTAEGFWRWPGGGRYRGIPLRNFAGWFVTALAVMGVLELALPAGAPDPVLVAEYAAMGAMETVGFGAFFGDRSVAVLGGAAMLPLAARAVMGVLRG
jgi:putative membrane protein